MHRIARLVLPALAILIVGVIGGSAASPAPTHTRQDAAKKILASGVGQNLPSPARSYVESVARNDHRLTPDTNGLAKKGKKLTSAAKPGGGSLANVRVNNPANDSHQVDQTTQSETAIAVSGLHMVVGFNDSQQLIQPFLTAGANLTGYAYSTDGGATFTDGGTIPNAPGNQNLGDPWLAVDSSGDFYYSSLTVDAVTGNLVIGVARSADGGKTFSGAASLPQPAGAVFYSADKDSMVAGPGNGNLYVAWDDLAFDQNFNFTLGLPVAHSTDGGQTWSLSYADKTTPTGCSFAQYIGANPLVSGGAVYVAAELISVDDPDCVGAPATFSEAVFVSKDGGSSWSAGAKIPVTSSTQNFGAFIVGPSQFVRNLEFPTLAILKGNVYMAWNDGGDGTGHSHIRLAQLDGSGNTSGSLSWVTSGANDEIQPAMSGDSGGLHVAYYQISTGSNGNGQFDVIVSNSTNGNSWKTQRVTSQSFPGVYTVPQFDPIIAFGYMGDYIAMTSDGGHQFMAWGDNRDIVNNFMWPSGRNDPDVFLAKQ